MCIYIYFFKYVSLVSMLISGNCSGTSVRNLCVNKDSLFSFPPSSFLSFTRNLKPRLLKEGQ